MVAHGSLGSDLSAKLTAGDLMAFGSRRSLPLALAFALMR